MSAVREDNAFVTDLVAKVLSLASRRLTSAAHLSKYEYSFFTKLAVRLKYILNLYIK